MRSTYRASRIPPPMPFPVASSRENPKPYHPTLHPTSSGLHPPVPGNGGNPFPPLKPELSVRKGQEWGGEHTSHPGQNQSYCRHSIYRTRNYLPVIGLPPPAPPLVSVPCFPSMPCVRGVKAGLLAAGVPIGPVCFEVICQIQASTQDWRTRGGKLPRNLTMFESSIIRRMKGCLQAEHFDLAHYSWTDQSI